MSNALFEIIKWLTPVFLFFLGFIINELFSRRKNYIERKYRREFIFFNIRSLIRRNENQVNEIKSCISRLADPNDTNIIVTRVTGNELVDLKELKPTEFYTIFYLKNKCDKTSNLEQFRHFRDSLDYIDTFYYYLFESNRDAFKRIISHYEDFNKSYLQFINLMNAFLIENNINKIEKGQDSFIDSLATIVDSVYEKYGNVVEKITIMFDEVIIPSKALCKIHSGNIRAHKLLSIILEAQKTFLEIEIRRKHEIEDLTNKSNGLESMNKKLKQSIDYFELCHYKR